MKRQNQTNALLVELLIVILFFMLGAVILIQVFASSYQMTGKAQVLAEAMAKAQNVADTLYASDDPAASLAELAFEEDTQRATSPELWVREEDGYVLSVTASNEAVEGGTMRRIQVQALSGDEVLITLPCSRYEADAA